MLRLFVLLIGCWLGLEGTAAGQEPLLVTGTIEVGGSTRKADLRDVAVWLTPIGESAPQAAASVQNKTPIRMLQRNKRFTPHVLIVRAGSVVEFPNADPFFHNVFSMYEGNRFDLGLYEAGTSRRVTFSRLGVSYVFCNIHPDMSSAILVVDTPYTAVSSQAGKITIPDVPPGRYTLSVWHERYTPLVPGAFPREVTISEANHDLGIVRFVDAGKALSAHKNKYGHDYNPPHPTSPLYK